MRFLKLVILTLGLMFNASLIAQVGTQGSLEGTVTDTTGAVIADAVVHLTNLETGQQLEDRSRGDGSFHILAVPPGLYLAEVSASSFKTWQQSNVSITVGDQIKLNPKLEVGANTETIEVKSNSDALQTENASVQTVIQMEQIRELPLDNRDPLQLLALTPGMIYEGQTTDTRVSTVRFVGQRNTTASFQLDGVTTTDGLYGGGTAVPNVDAVQQMNVQAQNPNAEAGRDPLQVLLQTRYGTNRFHGSVYEYFQNDYLNAWNPFQKLAGQVKPRVRYNLFGGTFGGPIRHDKLFFFLSFQETAKRNAQSYNVAAIPQTWSTGNFGTTTVYDPLTNAPFPGNVIPQSRWSPASAYFLPLILTANAPGSKYISSVAYNDIDYEGVIRVDYQITDKQRIYARHLDLDEPREVPGYSANRSLFGNSTLAQHNSAVTYTYTLTPNLLLTLTGGYMRSRQYYENPLLGKQNDAELAGIQGILSAGRERWIGPPTILISGYTGVSFAGGYGVPGELKNSVYTERVSLDWVHGKHQFSFGGEGGDRHVFGGHGSANPRGSFSFTAPTGANRITGNAFGDFLLGMTTSSSLNDPLPQFGQNSAKNMGAYAKDTWRILPNLTLIAAGRWDHVFPVYCYLNLCDSWDKKLQKVVVADDENGNPNFSTLAHSASLAQDMAGLWVTASQAGYGHGKLLGASDYYSPRVGIAFRPNPQMVFRAGYGTFFTIYTGNRGASMIGAPTFGSYTKAFNGAQRQRWETVWASDGHITSGYSEYAPVHNFRLAINHQWNVAVQAAMPKNISLTISYVGARVPNQITNVSNNIATVGPHANINNEAPFPRFGTINTYENVGKYWTNAMTTYAERRFRNGFSFTFAYAWAKTMLENTGDSETDAPLAYSPTWYNRHQSVNDYRHIQSSTMVFDLPYGHGRHFGNHANRFLDYTVGGWRMSLIETAHSGLPLVIAQSNLNLGNNQSSRANIVGDPNTVVKTRDHWFNTAAYKLAPSYTFGNSGVGDVYGPSFVQLNTSFVKEFSIRESLKAQLRGEAFNVLNHVNFGNPGTSISSTSTFGRISSSFSARYMQLAVKLTF